MQLYSFIFFCHYWRNVLGFIRLHYNFSSYLYSNVFEKMKKSLLKIILYILH